MDGSDDASSPSGRFRPDGGMVRDPVTAAGQADLQGDGPQASTSAGGSRDVVVVGGGCIGLATAWRAAVAGLHVTVADPHPGAGASWAAAGMLAPVTEVHYGEEALLRLNLASAERYPSFVEELELDADAAVGYRRCGTLFVAADSGDRVVLEELHRFQRSLGLVAELISGRECRSLEPMLAPGIRGGILAPADHQVDSRRLTPALLTAATRRGVALRRSAVAEVVVDGGRATGVRLEGGEILGADAVVLAAGCWSSAIPGPPAGALPAVRPVKGQVLHLRGPVDPPFLSRNLRGVARGSHVYLVPRHDGRVVLGATVEEKGFDTAVTAEAAYTLLRDARQLLPGVLELELAETHSGLRPGSIDNAPLLGPSAVPGLVIATGHYRNGVLLTPVTADALATYLSTGRLDEHIMPFSPARFVTTGTPSTAGPRGRAHSRELTR
jgi:glycine oxidase